MSSALRRRITFSNVISVIALFVALGGSVYAAQKISGKQIKRKSIPGNRLKNNSVTGSQVKESSLGVVPQAANAAALGGSQASSYLKSLTLRETSGAAVGNGAFGHDTAQCNPGERPVGGGVSLGSGAARITDSGPTPTTSTPTGWFGQAHGDTGADTIFVYVLCAS